MATTAVRFKALLTTACTAGLFLLAACSADGADERPDDGATGVTATTAPAPAREPDEDPASPLEEFLGFRVNHRPEGLDTAVPALNPDATGPSDEDRRNQLRLEEMIASCMRAEGFTYVVRDPFTGAAADPRNSPLALPREEFASRYGYGISTLEIPNATEVDPNYAALAAMKPAERQAYLWALDGAAEQGDTENTGCRGRAVKEVFGRSTAGAADPSDATAAFAPLVEEIRAVDERVDGDPRVAADASRRWADCMADAGHPGLTRPSDAANSVRSRLAQAQAAPGDPAALADVRRYEVSLARADFICRKAYDVARRQVRDELERHFIEEHRSELERYREALAG